MTDEKKKKRGRPRKYATEEEAYKAHLAQVIAYHKRNKAKVAEIKHRYYLNRKERLRQERILEDEVNN